MALTENTTTSHQFGSPSDTKLADIHSSNVLDGDCTSSSGSSSMDTNDSSLGHETPTATKTTSSGGGGGGGSSSSYKCSAVHTLERDMPDFDYSNLVGQLRSRILKEDQENPGLFSRADIVQCRDDDWHLSRFLLRQKLDLELAFEMLRKALRYRNESLASGCRPQDFPVEFYHLGGLFGYEPDRKGNLMLYIRLKVHRKVAEVNEVFQSFLYHQIDRLDKEAKGRGISIVLDCTGAGLANADMDMLLYLVSTLVNYFPKGLSYLLVHELPWILKPFWYIAKAWLSEDHRELVKFSDRASVYEYIDRENLPDFMGGTCERDYRAAPPDCTTLDQAAKLWGLEKNVTRRVLTKFADHLPAATLERAFEQLDKLPDAEESEAN